MNSDKLTKLFYSLVPMRFIRLHAHKTRIFIKRLSEEYDFNTNIILDIGAGSANHSTYFSKAKYVAQDIIQNDSKSIDYVYDICSSECVIDSESIDAILCSQVFEHLVDPKKALEEMFRILKPRGKVFLTTHMAFEEHMLPHDYWRFTEFGIKLLGKQAKFKVVHFKKHGATMNLIHYAFWTWPIRIFFQERTGIGYYLYSFFSTPFVVVTGILAEFLDFISKEEGFYTNFEIILDKS